MCYGNCGICPFNNNCVIKPKEEEIIMTNNFNEQNIKDIRKVYE